MIRCYQKYLSLDTGYLGKTFHSRGACRYTPTCSQYTYDAVGRYGIIVGLRMGLTRILRCHPWAPGGWDPVK